MEIQTLDFKNSRLVQEVLAIHCVYPLESKQPDEQAWACVPKNLAQLESGNVQTIYYLQDHGRVVAMLWLEVTTRHTGSIKSIWVDPAYRRRGHAKTLLREGEQWFLNQGTQLISAEADGNNALHSLARIMGYNLNGQRLSRDLAESQSA